uniref:SulP family inorganic anion transporter n=1 Tax=Sandarakinorhabdus sp. TaxID=1916663 RepID=UPI0035692ADF
ADSRLSTMLHGTWLLLGLAVIPAVLNLIPLSALAAVLIATGYKLAKPALFFQRWKQGFSQFIPFTVTVFAILFTDLLIGIGIGLIVGMGFVIWRSTGNIITYVEYGDTVMVRARRNLYFMHKPALQQALERVPEGSSLLIDLSATSYVDLDCIDIINGFTRAAQYRGIDVKVRADHTRRSAAMINAPVTRARAT